MNELQLQLQQYLRRAIIEDITQGYQRILRNAIVDTHDANTLFPDSVLYEELAELAKDFEIEVFIRPKPCQEISGEKFLSA